MTEKRDKPEIWTPPEKIDENVRRMAWLLFLEIWKRATFNKFTIAFTGAHASLAAWAGKEYVNCLEVAKIVRKLELHPMMSIKLDDNDAKHMKLAQELEDERRESEDQT